MRRRRRFRGPLAVAAVVLAGAALSGCGVAGTTFHPGVAAKVGDQTIATDEIDRLTTAVCDAYEGQLEDNNSVVPLRSFKSGIVESLALTTAVEQVGKEYDVTPGDQYRREVTSVTSSATGLPQSQVDALLVAQTSTTLIQDVLGQVGAKLLAADGATDDTTDDTDTDSDSGDTGSDDSSSSAASDEAFSAGTEALRTWLSENDVEIDPEYAVEIGIFEDSDGQVSFARTTDSSVSFALSDAAEAGTLEEPDQAKTMQLPESQRCGKYVATAAAGTS